MDHLIKTSPQTPSEILNNVKCHSAHTLSTIQMCPTDQFKTGGKLRIFHINFVF